MDLTERQLEHLRRLAAAEMHFATLANGVRDGQQHMRQHLEQLARDRATAVTALRDYGPRREGQPEPRAAAELRKRIDTLDQRIASVQAQIEAADNGPLRAYIALRTSLSNTIDRVLAHVGTTRDEVGIGYYRSTPSVYPALGA